MSDAQDQHWNDLVDRLETRVALACQGGSECTEDEDCHGLYRHGLVKALEHVRRYRQRALEDLHHA